MLLPPLPPRTCVAGRGRGGGGGGTRTCARWLIPGEKNRHLWLLTHPPPPPPPRRFAEGGEKPTARIRAGGLLAFAVHGNAADQYGRHRCRLPDLRGSGHASPRQSHGHVNL